MPISGVGTFNSASGNGLSTKSIVSTNSGDLISVATMVISGSILISSLSGGGADTTAGGTNGWLKRVSLVDGGATIEIWTARVGTPGTATVTVTWSSAIGTTFVGICDRQFTAGLGPTTVWALDGSASGQANVSATTCAFPTKVPTAAGRLYLGYGFGHAAPLTAGSTAGYTYHIDPIDNCYLWNPSVAASTSPTTGVTAAQTSAAIGMLFTASPPPGGWVPPVLSSYNSFH